MLKVCDAKLQLEGLRLPRIPVVLQLHINLLPRFVPAQQMTTAHKTENDKGKGEQGVGARFLRTPWRDKGSTNAMD